MSIPGISPTLISQAFITPAFSGGEGQSRLSSDDLFKIGMLALLGQIHESVMDAWETFKDGQKEIRERKESIEDSRHVRGGQDDATRLEGQRRQVESRQIETEGDVPMHASRPHRGKRLFHEGNYLDSSSRQLNLPV